MMTIFRKSLQEITRVHEKYTWIKVFCFLKAMSQFPVSPDEFLKVILLNQSYLKFKSHPENHDCLSGSFKSFLFGKL